ncbi:hypothetical protein E1B28_011416 [Marasmius oreades]|uniref:P-loop containing nucleoside triphosphate hydrolase protein n=1 Tax=Marasmius oreades TaxID=181124 RepID=A0A9P7UPJ8_9AGAR|nr:uncharacterized protein E1B28_011416 [Marasmius oreades]KAG7089762.1 hypothetical protein E1B28_011416 [Marasmius oreades]
MSFPMDTVLQQIFKISVAENTSSASNSSGAFQRDAPNNLSSFIGLFFSFSALRDWLKLIVIGGVIETCRRSLFMLYDKAMRSFWMNAYFEDEDAVYDWMMLWLAKQPSWKNKRDVEISTHTYGANMTSIQLNGEDNATAFYKSSRKLTYLPSLSTTYSLWYRGRYMTITRTQQQTGWYGHKERTLRISILTRRQSLLVELLQEARDAYLADQAHSMCVFVSDVNNNWKHVACRPKRSMRSIILDPGVKDMLLEDARDFLASKAWYAERGIPFRRGYLLYGAPGSGKTSLIHSMAGELGLDVYIVSLSRAGLDDNSLGELINELPERCIALMEDIDAAFTHAVSRDSAPSTSMSSTPGNVNPPSSTGNLPVPGVAASRLSLSGLLNALDGVGAQEGRILFATTNKYSSLDPALCRPGRMDVHVEFKLASKFQATELFARFYNPFEHLETKEDGHGGEKEIDSGYGSADGDAEGSVKEESAGPEDIDTKALNHSTPKLSNGQIRTMAVQFADALPDREFSMAALQGYLMLYKTRPFTAVQNFEEWIRTEREDRGKREKEKKEDETKVERERKEKEDKEKEEKDRKEKADKEDKETREKMVKEMREKVEKEVREKVENEMRIVMENELRQKIPT